VLDRHSEPVRPLPPRTSEGVLDRVSSELAGALTGGSGRGVDLAGFGEGERVVSLDAARSCWFRCHPDLLQVSR